MYLPGDTEFDEVAASRDRSLNSRLQAVTVYLPMVSLAKRHWPGLRVRVAERLGGAARSAVVFMRPDPRADRLRAWMRSAVKKCKNAVDTRGSSSYYTSKERRKSISRLQIS